MKYTGTIHTQEDIGDAVRIGITNVKGTRDAVWRNYSKTIEFDVHHSAAKTFPIGRSVTIEIKPK